MLSIALPVGIILLQNEPNEKSKNKHVSNERFEYGKVILKTAE